MPFRSILQRRGIFAEYAPVEASRMAQGPCFVELRGDAGAGRRCRSLVQCKCTYIKVRIVSCLSNLLDSALSHLAGWPFLSRKRAWQRQTVLGSGQRSSAGRCALWRAGNAVLRTFNNLDEDSMTYAARRSRTQVELRSTDSRWRLSPHSVCYFQINLLTSIGTIPPKVL